MNTKKVLSDTNNPRYSYLYYWCPYHVKVTLWTAYVGAIKKPFQLGKAIHKNHEKRMSVIFFYVSLRHNN